MRAISDLNDLEQNLVNSGTLGGSGTIVVAGGNGAVVITSGSVQAPGNSPGTQTVVGTNLWQSGGTYQWEINDWAGTQGSNPGWDWHHVSTAYREFEDYEDGDPREHGRGGHR